MNDRYMLFYIVISVLLLLLVSVSAAFMISVIRKRKKIKFLTESIDEFIRSGTAIPLSTADDEYAHLQTNICELQEILMRERYFTIKEAQSNTQFISDISHQLKTPLAGLKLYCEMENASSPDEHTEKELQLIKKMEMLIRNVLRLEKIRSDTYTMSFENTDIAKLAEEIKMDFSHLFPQQTITVTGSALIRADRNWLGEALGNIVKNSCEHTEKNGRTDILIEELEKSVSITISDNGGGVSEEELPLLFNRFHRTQTAAPDSAGIGLAITKAIVEKHHGTIEASNTKDGLSIIICLPVIDANLKI